MNRVTVTVKIYSGIMREVRTAAKRWGVSIDETIEDMLRRHLSKDARDEEAMKIIRDAAALLEKDQGVTMRKIDHYSMLDQPVITEADIFRPDRCSIERETHISGQKSGKAQGPRQALDQELDHEPGRD
jgi:hypothetical protein